MEVIAGAGAGAVEVEAGAGAEAVEIVAGAGVGAIYVVGGPDKKHKTYIHLTITYVWYQITLTFGG